MELDSLDYKIINLLCSDSRLSSGEIAKLVYASPRTVRARIERLVREQVLRFTVWIDRKRLGYQAAADIFVQVESRRVEEVAQRVAQYPEVVYIAITTGSQDVSINVHMRSIDDIHRFVHDKIASLPGVLRTNTFIVFKVVRGGPWTLPLPPPDDT